MLKSPKWLFSINIFLVFAYCNDFPELRVICLEQSCKGWEDEKKVCMMSSVHKWDDNRVFKESSSLAKQYRIDLCAVGDFSYRRVQGVDVFGLPDLKKRYWRPLNWFRLLLYAKKTQACVYHLHDPELIPLGLILKLFGRKVIYDVHEDYFDAILHKYWLPKPTRKTIAVVFNTLEKMCSKFFDAIIFAEIAYKDSFPGTNKLKADILNYPLLTTDYEPVDKKNRQCINLIYSGGISAIRGAEQMIAALALLVGEGINVHLLLVGPFLPSAYEARIKQMITDYRLQNHVTVTGRIPPSELDAYYRRADIGLALLHPVENYLKSQASKLFEYMAAGIPIVASDFPRWKALLQDVGAGLTVDPYDPEAIAAKIKWLLNDAQLRLCMGKNGRRAYLERFNWNSEELKLLSLYGSLLREENRAPDLGK